MFSRLDEWIRRRVRMCFWKQWRYPRTRIRKLLQLGVSRDQAISHGASRKGYWRLSAYHRRPASVPHSQSILAETRWVVTGA